MKHFYFPIFTCAALAILMGGCNDDAITKGKPQDAVRFAVATGSDWKEAKTRGDSRGGREYASVTMSEPQGGSDTFYLHARAEDMADGASAQTRGASINSLADQSISVTAFAFDSWDDSLAPNFMVDEELKTPWTTDHYWPGNGMKVQFFAHCPYAIDGWSRVEAGGYPRYSYQVPAEAADQSDILVAWTGELSDKAKDEVSLSFNHALTRIKFSAAEDFENGTINSITLNGVYGAGEFSFADREWSVLDKPTDFENHIDKEVTSAGGNLLDDELTFMMIPQTFGEDSEASVTITFTSADNGAEQTLDFPLKGHEWKKGKVLNYRLSLTPKQIIPVLEVNGMTDEAEMTFTYEGGIQPLVVKSYNRVIAGDKETLEPVDWTFVTEDGDETGKELPGDWFMVGDWEEPEEETPQTRSDDDEMAEKLGVEVYPQDPVITNPANDRLKAAAPLTQVRNLANHKADTYFDLTTNEETANCYIVNCAGTYSFPMVYGNAIMGGQPNISSYSTTKTNAGLLKKFKNAKGEEITDSEIEKDLNIKVSDAVLVWQDYPNLIQNIHVTHDEAPVARVEFSVLQSDIGQGNAIIAIRDNMGVILWSWHIWVTDYDPYAPTAVFATASNSGGIKFSITSQNLGWCEGTTFEYTSRSETLRLRQAAAQNCIRLNVVQNEYRSESLGNNTYYQYGRKDPMPGAFGNQVDKPWYVEIDKYNWTYQYGCTSIEDGIRRPYTSFPAGEDSWLNENDCKYTNLWNTGFTKVTTAYSSNACLQAIKSIYDPCPPGMVIPAPGDLYYLCSQGLDWDASNTGILTRTTPKILFPATGYRAIMVSKPFLVEVPNQIARVWSWGTTSGIESWHLCVKSEEDNPGNTIYEVHKDNCYTCSGLPIKPVRYLSSDIWK